MLSRRTFLGGLAAAAMPAIDTDGMLLVRGKRTFVHGLYQLPNVANALDAAAQAGFHVVHGSTAADLDAARERGMYRWITTSANAAKIAERVKQFAAHPALLYWETEDEPSYQWNKPDPRLTPQVMKQAYALLKKLDPARAVYVNHSPTNLVSTLQQYNPCADILATDIYPVIPHGIRPQYALWPDGRQGDFLNTHISQTGQYMDKLRAVAGPNRAAFMVLQAFAWENLREKDRDPAMIRYPTAAELRFMAFHSIVRGANGLVWWGLKYTPAGEALWNHLAALTRELRSLDAELAAPAVGAKPRFEYHDTGHSLDRGIEWIAKPSLFIAVNADPNPVDVTISGVLPKPRRERFQPFDVRLLRP